MPSKNPRINVVLDDKLYKNIQFLAETEGVSQFHLNVQRPVQIKRLQLFRNQRIELETPGPSAQ